jgi:tetratricopeptide (TPR) repeat protein
VIRSVAPSPKIFAGHNSIVTNGLGADAVNTPARLEAIRAAALGLRPARSRADLETHRRSAESMLQRESVTPMPSYSVSRWVLVLMIAAVPAFSQTLETGMDLYRTQRYEQAEHELRGVTQNNPENAEAHYYLGMTLVELNRLEDAQAEFDKTKEMSVPQDQQKVAEARLQMARKEMDPALATLREAEELDAGNADVYLYRGLIHASRQNFPEAITNLEKSMQINPHNARAHYYAGIAYNRTGRPDKMVEHFQIFLKQAPDSPDAAKVRSMLRSVR